jgi:hypothetical protein
LIKLRFHGITLQAAVYQAAKNGMTSCSATAESCSILRTLQNDMQSGCRICAVSCTLQNDMQSGCRFLQYIVHSAE